jgi:hypothetical protein
MTILYITRLKTRNDTSAQYNNSENEEPVYMNNISELNIDESYQNNACESQTPNKNKDMNENKSKRNEEDFTNIEELRTSYSDLCTDTLFIVNFIIHAFYGICA